jgi:hypothetical protein
VVKLLKGVKAGREGQLRRCSALLGIIDRISNYKSEKDHKYRWLLEPRNTAIFGTGPSHGDVNMLEDERLG